MKYSPVSPPRRACPAQRILHGSAALLYIIFEIIHTLKIDCASSVKRIRKDRREKGGGFPEEKLLDGKSGSISRAPAPGREHPGGRLNHRSGIYGVVHGDSPEGEKALPKGPRVGIGRGRFRSERAKRRVLDAARSEEHTFELQSRENLVCRLLL